MLINGLSCEEFAKLLSKASGEKVSLRWLESCFQFTQNGVYTSHQTVFLDSCTVFAGELICLVMVRDTNYQTNRNDGHAFFIRFWVSVPQPICLVLLWKQEYLQLLLIVMTICYQLLLSSSSSGHKHTSIISNVSNTSVVNISTACRTIECNSNESPCMLRSVEHSFSCVNFSHLMLQAVFRVHDLRIRNSNPKCSGRCEVHVGQHIRQIISVCWITFGSLHYMHQARRWLTPRGSCQSRSLLYPLLQHVAISEGQTIVSR